MIWSDESHFFFDEIEAIRSIHKRIISKQDTARRNLEQANRSRKDFEEQYLTPGSLYMAAISNDPTDPTGRCGEGE